MQVKRSASSAAIAEGFDPLAQVRPAHVLTESIRAQKSTPATPAAHDEDAQPPHDAAVVQISVSIEGTGGTAPYAVGTEQLTCIRAAATLALTQRRREELIKQHYAGRLAQVARQAQFADAKAVAYYEECRSLSQQLEVSPHICCAWLTCTGQRSPQPAPQGGA